MKLFTRCVSFIYLVVFIYVLSVLFVFERIITFNQVANWILLIGIIPLFFYTLLKKQTDDISLRKYLFFSLILFGIVLLYQIFIVKYGWFLTGWDAGMIRGLAESFADEGKLFDVVYLTRNPNNIFLVFLVTLIKKLPGFAGSYAALLLVNCLLVDAACFVGGLTIRNILNKNSYAFLSYLISAPLILLNPWFLIPYSDTFAILLPISVLCIYTKKEKWLIDYFLIGFLSVLGYLIKPTVIIVLIAILIASLLFKNFQLDKKSIKKIIIVFCLLGLGITSALSLKSYATSYLHFKPDPETVEFNWKHFLAMGENDETIGVYSASDVEDSANYGMDSNITKFWERLMSRNYREQIEFFSKKTLVNFNYPAFAWNHEGNFYLYVPESDSLFTKMVRNIYYLDGDFYQIFLTISQLAWLFVLCLCLFTFKLKNNRNELVIMLSLLGIIFFVTIFEARTRYLYCYSPVFVCAAMLGIYHLRMLVQKKN